MNPLYMKRALFLLLYFLISLSQVYAQFEIDQVRVEYEKSGQEVTVNTLYPRFSWQLNAGEGRRGVTQTAYAIQVKDSNGQILWNSGKVGEDTSLGIRYNGNKPLQPNQKYTYELTVGDNTGHQSVYEGAFFTALLDDTLEAWSGAEWIGGGDGDLVFYSHYFSVYKFNFDVQLARGSQKAAFVFGGNDTRLMNRNLNMQGVENGPNESFIAFELDITALQSPTGKAILHVFRVGYDPKDTAETPFVSLDIPRNLINPFNQYERHSIHAESNFGVFTIYVNGQEMVNRISPFNPEAPRFVQQGLNLNPIGSGNNFISFPMLADIGFWMKPDQEAQFSNVQVRNFREPSNILFSEELTEQDIDNSIFGHSNALFKVKEGAYVVKGGKSNTLILADPSKNAAPMLRTSFRTANKEIKHSRLYVTARGIYEFYANGERIGKEYFNPGLTQYDKHHPYQVYSLDLKQGSENVLGAWLSEGWWSGNITYSGENWNYFGDRQSLLAKLVITYTDGTEQLITSQPGTWKIFHDGPVRYGSFFQGEVYDANKELLGWASPGFDDRNWDEAQVVSLEGMAFQDPIGNPQSGEIIRGYEDMKLIYHQGEKPKIVKKLTPISVEEVRPGVFVYDMGQNMVGFPQIRLKNAIKGQKITLRYAEVRYPDLPEHKGMEGMIMLENIRAALTQDTYIAKGGEEIIQPRFTFHGYRFLEITGVPNTIPIEDVRGMVVSSIDELTAHYETSNPLVNKLWENITWSMRGNFLSIPTDTPARNERMGWSGDINVFTRTASYMADSHLFLRRHLLAMRDIQRPDGRFPDVAPVGGGFGGTLWGSAGIIVPWETYLQYGDMTILEGHYGAMKKYMKFLDDRVNDQGILNEGPLGDWLSPENNKNDNTLLWTAYQVYCLEIMEKSAALMDLALDAAYFKLKKLERRQFFNQTYLDHESGKTIKSGQETGFMLPPGEIAPDATISKGQLVDTQGSYAIALNMGAVEEKYKAKVLENLITAIERENVDDLGEKRPSYSLMTGFIGTASISSALSKAGKHEMAYRILQQTSYPSWLYSVVNGATTIWERLNSYTVENGFGGNNSMNSFNHYSFGAIGAWMMNYSLGIQSDLVYPGFKHFILQPSPDPDGVMTWANGYYDSYYGRIESSWRLEENKVVYNFVVPANTSAKIKLQVSEFESITSGGKALSQISEIKNIEKHEGMIHFDLSSGRYQFEVKR